MRKITLDKSKTIVSFEFEDSWGGCAHEVSVKTLLRVLKPVNPPKRKVVYK